MRNTVNADNDGRVSSDTATSVPGSAGAFDTSGSPQPIVVYRTPVSIEIVLLSTIYISGLYTSVQLGKFL